MGRVWCFERIKRYRFPIFDAPTFTVHTFRHPRPERDRTEIFIAFRSTGTGKQSGNLSCRLFRRRGTKLHSVVNGRKWRRPCVVGR